MLINPCSYDLPNVLCVGSLDQKGNISRFSNYGKKSVDIMAPGTDIYSTMPPHKSEKAGPINYWGSMSGTSMATPMVSGVAALLVSRYPDLTTAQLRASLLGGVVKEQRYKLMSSSKGRLDAVKALNYASFFEEYANKNEVTPKVDPVVPKIDPVVPDPVVTQPDPVVPKPDPVVPNPEPVVPVDPTPPVQKHFTRSLHLDFYNQPELSLGNAMSVWAYDLNTFAGAGSGWYHWDQKPQYSYDWCPYTAEDLAETSFETCWPSGIVNAMN